MADFDSGVGPLFGPDFVEVVVNDDTGVQFTLQVYPDARNADLRNAGLAMQYYYQPQRVYIAKKQDSPSDFDFGMTVFKGLATSETTIGLLNPAVTPDGTAELGGGFCSFSTTFAVPDSVIAHAIQKLKTGDHPAPSPRLVALFGGGDNDAPDPRLGAIPITDDTVTIAVPDLMKAADGTKVPMFISAQTSTKGSIEAHGYSSFLITCNEFAAGAIAGSLQNGISPFVVNNSLKESFYVNAVTATVHVDVDKVYKSFSAAVSGSYGFLSSVSASAAYSDCLTSGAITTEMQENGAAMGDDLKKWVEQKVEDMRKLAIDLVKQQIFDWDPSKTDSQASADRGWLGNLFGGASVSMKANYQESQIKLDQTLILNETVSVDQTVEGDLNDLMADVKTNLQKYLAIVDIGEYFQKIQIAASSAVNFGQTLADGTVLKDPLVSVQLEAGYPQYSSPLDASGQPNLDIHAEGSHYTLASPTPTGGVSPAIWTADNAKDFVNISWLRLDADVTGWPRDQVMLHRKLIFDGNDPRVNLTSASGPDGGVIVDIVEPASLDHAPILTAAQVGYVYVKFRLVQLLPKSNITVEIVPTIGSDTYGAIEITNANQQNILWEVFSDKYQAVDHFTYTVQVTITGPDFTDTPVVYSTAAPVNVPVPIGRIKYLNPLAVPLPPVPADQLATVRQYIHDTPA